MVHWVVVPGGGLCSGSVHVIEYPPVTIAFGAGIPPSLPLSSYAAVWPLGPPTFPVQPCVAAVSTASIAPTAAWVVVPHVYAIRNRFAFD